MNDTPNAERQPSIESQHPYPHVGDIVAARDHFPRGVVLSSNATDGIAAAAIKILDDGTEQLGLPGTLNVAEIQSIEGRWDADRITEAWANTWKANGLELSTKAQNDFRNTLLASAAIHAVETAEE